MRLLDCEKMCVIVCIVSYSCLTPKTHTVASPVATLRRRNKSCVPLVYGGLSLFALQQNHFATMYVLEVKQL